MTNSIAHRFVPPWRCARAGASLSSLEPSERAPAPHHYRIFCDDCCRVILKPGLCPDCLEERARIRKLRWLYKRKNTPARRQRFRPKKENPHETDRR